MGKAGFSRQAAEETVDPEISCKLVVEWWVENIEMSSSQEAQYFKEMEKPCPNYRALMLVLPRYHHGNQSFQRIPRYVVELAMTGRITKPEDVGIAIMTSRLLGDPTPINPVQTATGRFSTSPNIAQIPRTK